MPVTGSNEALARMQPHGFCHEASLRIRQVLPLGKLPKPLSVPATSVQGAMERGLTCGSRLRSQTRQQDHGSQQRVYPQSKGALVETEHLRFFREVEDLLWLRRGCDELGKY